LTNLVAETGYDHDIRIAAALSGVRKIGYVYDLGASWEHEITLEKKLPLDPGADIPGLCRVRWRLPGRVPRGGLGTGLSSLSRSTSTRSTAA
jgi:Plasmid pRiA4b ORF-3-like protein